MPVSVLRCTSLWAGLTVCAILALGWAAYMPALGGTFLFDDWHNLSGLATVADFNSAIQYIFSGSAGPAGRPLALASFALQANQWGASARPFILVNILIHLLNGALACLFFLQLAQTQRIEKKDAHLVAVIAMGLWLFMPLLASSSLLVAQRMTTLSATFVLLGITAYLYFRSRLEVRSGTALVGMSLAIVVAGTLAMLSKENGVLMPLLILALEATLLTRPKNIRLSKWRTWQLVFLIAPTLVVATVLIMQLPYNTATVLQKDFTGWQKLLTEARVLWTYAGHAIVAQPYVLGPFHDNYRVSRSLLEPLTLLSVVAWLVVIFAAIRWRRRFSVAAFAVLWFLTGHLLESTTVPLNVYFEHRNYLPLAGPIFALSFLLLLNSGQYRRFALVALGLYVVVNAGILYSVTSLWGDPLLAAGYWQQNSLDSPAAVRNLADQQAENLGAQAAAVTLQEFVNLNPQDAYLRISELTLLCATKPGGNYDATVADLKAKLPQVAYAPSTGPLLDRLLDTIHGVDCGGADLATVKELILALYRNPHYSSNEKYSSMHHQLLAKLARNSGDVNEALRQLAIAKSIRNNIDFNAMAGTLLVGEN